MTPPLASSSLCSTQNTASTATTLVGTDHYKLASAVANHIDFIQPAVVFAPQGKINHSARRPLTLPPSADSASCDKRITPDCLRTMYNFPIGSLSDPCNDLGIFEETSQPYNQSDLGAFYAKYATNVPTDTAPKLVTINQQDPIDSTSFEADLGHELAVPIIYPQTTVNYAVAKTNTSLSFWDPLLRAFDGSYCTDGGDCGTLTPTNVISMSYGNDEIDFARSYLRVRNSFPLFSIILRYLSSRTSELT